jgi:hypothetical protein
MFCFPCEQFFFGENNYEECNCECNTLGLTRRLKLTWYSWQPIWFAHMEYKQGPNLTNIFKNNSKSVVLIGGQFNLTFN